MFTGGVSNEAIFLQKKTACLSDCGRTCLCAWRQGRGIVGRLHAHTPTRRRTVTSAPRRIAGITASNDLWRFVARNDLLAHLETAVRLAKECFKNIDQLGFSYDVDPEIENESWISIRAGIKGTLDELLLQWQAFDKAMVRSLPTNKQALILFSPRGESEVAI